MFNIITPTYNRAHTLERVYESLKNQTYKSFSWIIIDDCSSDTTKSLVNQWLSDNIIDIEYHFLAKNKGKSNAVNVALDLCDQPYVIIADSDDSFDSNTLSDLKDTWNKIDTDVNGLNVASIWTLTKRNTGEIIGDKFPKDYWRVDFNERVLRHTITGEKWASWRTSILKDQKMYHTEHGCHIPESLTWNSINKTYDFVCINLAHRTYFESSDGLIATKKSTKKRAKIGFYIGYYGLKDVTINDLLKYPFYHNYAFEWIKAKPYFKDEHLKLSLKKQVVASFLFIKVALKKLLNK